TRRRTEVRAAFPLQQSVADLRKIQRHLPEKSETEGRRHGPAAFWSRSERNRSGSREGATPGRSGSRGRRRKILSHDVLGAAARNRESRSVDRKSTRLNSSH